MTVLKKSRNIDDLLNYAVEFVPETNLPGVDRETFKITLDKNHYSTIDSIKFYQHQYNLAMARLEAQMETEKSEKEKTYEKWAKELAQEVRTSRM